MEILQESELARYLFNRYSLKPKNWNFIISLSQVHDSFFDAIISNPDEIWQLKIDSIYKPNPIIMGAKVDNDLSRVEKRFNTTTSFGYRNLETNKIMNFLKNLSMEQNSNSIKESEVNTQLNSLLSSIEPVKPIAGKDYIYGPFLFTEKRLPNFDKTNQKVSEQISSKMKEKLRMRYSSYG
ncbi:MAG: hypothetical protein MRJ93_07055 [Nitrososphaeraceae archaeon]|nr:hypothetical protein [Nitrososphaeraceae archaeon]